MIKKILVVSLILATILLISFRPKEEPCFVIPPPESVSVVTLEPTL